MTASSPLESRIRDLLDPILGELDLSLWDLQVHSAGGRGRKIKVFLDRAGDSEPGSGVTIGEITKVSKQLGYLLDVEDVVPFEYHLEVSSPGIERDLVTDAHFARYLGERVRAVVRPLGDEPAVAEGVLREVHPDTLSIEVDGGTMVEVERDRLRRVRTVFDFSIYDGGPKPKKGSGKARQGAKAGGSKR